MTSVRDAMIECRPGVHRFSFLWRDRMMMRAVAAEVRLQIWWQA